MCPLPTHPMECGQPCHSGWLVPGWELSLSHSGPASTDRPLPRLQLRSAPSLLLSALEHLGCPHFAVINEAEVNALLWGFQDLVSSFIVFRKNSFGVSSNSNSVTGRSHFWTSQNSRITTNTTTGPPAACRVKKCSLRLLPQRPSGRLPCWPHLLLWAVLTATGTCWKEGWGTGR